MPTITRRTILLAGLGTPAALGLTGCRSIEERVSSRWIDEPTLAPQTASSPELRLLQRAAFGQTEGELARMRGMTPDAWVAEQLSPESIDESPVVQTRVRALGDMLDADPGLLFDIDDHVAVAALRQATILRAVYSGRQVFERMVHFWSDHFNIYAFKNEGAQYKALDDRLTIRPHALGRFRDLLGASARSAAMIGYLDISSNRKGVPNENYARELMELHTMGVGSGYTQRDVEEVARCFTGWTVDRHWYRGRFRFDPDAHDDGAKRVLGHAIPPTGADEGEAVMDIVAAHPATAAHISKKLCLAFLGTVPDSLHSAMTANFLATGGQIKPLMQILLTSPEVASGPPILKRPFDYAVSSLRALGADTDGGAGIQTHLDAMGQPLFAWPMPDGYPLRPSAWSSGLIPRWKFAAALASDQTAGTTVPWKDIHAARQRQNLDVESGAVRALFGENGTQKLVNSIKNAAQGDLQRAVAVGMMSPEFQFR